MTKQQFKNLKIGDQVRQNVKKGNRYFTLFDKENMIDDKSILTISDIWFESKDLVRINAKEICLENMFCSKTVKEKSKKELMISFFHKELILVKKGEIE